jgi:hypothetical protein
LETHWDVEFCWIPRMSWPFSSRPMELLWVSFAWEFRRKNQGN